MRKDSSLEWSQEFHLAGAFLITASIIAGLVVSLLVASHEQKGREQGQQAVVGDVPAPVVLFTTPTPPVILVAIQQPATRATSVPVVTTAPVPTAESTPAVPTNPPEIASNSATQPPPLAQPGLGGAPPTASVEAPTPRPKVEPTVGADATSGAAAFGTLCGACHPGGKAGLGPALMGLPAETIKTAVRSGKGMMPAFADGSLSDQKLLDIIEFLQNGR